MKVKSNKTKTKSSTSETICIQVDKAIYANKARFQVQHHKSSLTMRVQAFVSG